MPSLGLTSWNLLLHWIVYFNVVDISCSLVDFNLTSHFEGDPKYDLSPNNVEGKAIKRRQAQGDWCVIPPPMQHGKYRPSRVRCLPDNTTPGCQLTEGAFVFPDWVIFVDYCDPGYVVTSKHSVAVCSKGRWLPRLPTCGACPQSETLVNGRTVCKGEVIFEDTFNGQLSDKWRKRVAFSHESLRWKFNEWSSDKKNIFISNGNLVIKPTIHHDAYVTSASVEIEGCTDGRGSSKCKRTGTPDKILPPVVSADLHTINSFSFTYGEVEIRAKFPKGDWLMPGLYMDAVDFSSTIEVGVTLGNSDLRCNGEDFGLGRVGARLTIGPHNKKRQREFFLKNLSEKWHDDYHNYTTIWTPSGILFKIDNELIGDITPGDKTLCETYSSFTKEDCLIYSNRSKMAPLDKEITISLSLSAGDLGSITDGCLNRNRVKPWNIYEPQATLKFWQDRNNWLPTWSEDGSALYIDHIRVTAV